MLTIPPRSDQSQSVCPHPIAIPFYFCLAGGILFFGMGDGVRSGFFKEEAAESNAKLNFNIVPSFIISYCVMSSLKENAPSAFASGNSARATSAYCRWRHFTRNGSNLER